jgi:hyperosmotically inducible protein
MLNRNLIPNVAVLLFIMLLGSIVASAAKGDKERGDVFLAGGRDESRIARDVRHQLLMLPYYGVFDDLAFRVDGDTVTLLGEVVRPTLMDDADHAAKAVEGLRRVINRIEVLPVSPMDDQIRMAEYRAVYGVPVVSTKYGCRALPSIHIGIRANSVPYVFSVTNELQVEE